VASGPAQGWTAIAARKAGLDLVNLGYAAAGRGELVSAEHIAGLRADIITIAYGASCWSRIPHSAGMVAEGFHGFLDVVRQGHPTAPIVVISPIVRPDAETATNRLGASLGDIRHAIESVTRDRMAAGDGALSLVNGGEVLNADHLADGIHPGDEGHKRLAAAAAKALHAATAPAVVGVGVGAGGVGDDRPADLEGLRTPTRVPHTMIRPGGSDPAPAMTEPAAGIAETSPVG
jgi:lysophospholipase L1-like esterase